MHASIAIIQGCVLMAVLSASKAYHYPDTYSVTDDGDEDEDEISEEAPQKEDYTKYFSGSGNVANPGTAQTAADSSAGFVQPIDFAHLFTGSSFEAPEAIKGVIATPTASNIFAIHAAPVIPGIISGVIPGIATSATNHNQSSQIGFVNPNPNVEFQALFDSARAHTGPVYQRQPFFNRYAHPATLISQPVSSYSMYLPHFESIKSSVTKDVLDGQRQATQSTQTSKPKSTPSPRGSVENDEYYDGQDDEDDSEEDETDDEGNEGNDERYTYEQSEQQPTSHIPSRPTKSRYPKKTYPTNKKSAFDNPYPYKKSESSISKTYEKNNQRNKKPNKKSHSSTKSDYGYSSLFDYPSTGLEEPPLKQKKKNTGQRQATNNRPVAAFNSKYLGTKLHNSNKDYAHVPYPHSNPTVFPTFPLKMSNTQYAANSQPVKAIYPNNPKPTLHGGFVPSASIPYAKGFPSSYKIPYTPPVSLMEAQPSLILPKDSHIKAHSSEIARNTKKCIKIEKQPNGETSNNPAQVCYKCHDVATGANYEQCSYDSHSKSKPYFETEFEALKAEKSVKQVSPRSKRDVMAEPYDFSFSRDMNTGQSVTLIRKVRQYSEYDESPQSDDAPYSSEERDNYRFGPEYFQSSESSPEEADATEEVADGDSSEQCRKVKKNGIICMVCTKPSGGMYEQCSYASHPKENSYSYGTSTSYSKGSKPKSNRRRRYTGLSDSNHEHSKRKVRKYKNPNRISKHDGSETRDEEYDETADTPEDYSESIARIRKADDTGKLVDLDPFFYGSADETLHPEETKRSESADDDGSENDEESDDETAATSKQPSTYDDYFARLFPELKSDATETQTMQEKTNEDDYENSNDYNAENDEDEEQTKPVKKKLAPALRKKNKGSDYFDDTEHRKDLELVLGEFKQKDRSSCKKVMKDKMTCYQCLDDKGMQHEECMFVAASEPKNKHVAYHEVKQFQITPPKNTKSANKLQTPIEGQTPDSYNNHNEQGDKNRATIHQRSIADATLNPAPSNVAFAEADNDSHAAENLDIMRLYPKNPLPYPVSTVTIQNQRYYSSTGSPKTNPDTADTNRRTKRLPADEFVTSESKRSHHHAHLPNNEDERTGKRQNKKSSNQGTSKQPYNPIPTEPPEFDDREGPEGAYSKDTEPAFDTVLKITLPKYMLERSEHEAIFDEVLASG